jgi:8-oxo-dGTP pyrophosphatase MutT (NUDIX family)
MSENKKNNKVPDSWYNQSGVIPYRIKDGSYQILLITSRRKKRWIIPKGVIDDKLSPQESAAKEALEEAGALGEVNKEMIGRYKFKKWNGKVSVAIYPMLVKSLLDKWEEDDFRKRQWFSFKEAKEIIEISKIKKILVKFDEQINSKS